MFSIVTKGGPVMYLLILLSLWGLTLIVKKFLFLNSHHVDRQFYSEKTKSLLLSKGKEATIKELRSTRVLMLKILAFAIKQSALPKEQINENLKEITLAEIPRLERNMSILSSIITVAPIMGLMGTVLGLMNIFGVISSGRLGDATALSGGIAEALITTVAGLAIAIPFIFFHQYLSHKIDVFISDTERLVNDVVEFCKHQSGVKP